MEKLDTDNLGPIKVEPGPTFLDRLKAEKEELSDKFQRLVQFTHQDNAKFRELTGEHQKLLVDQANAMGLYLTILTARLDLLEAGK
jgi:hypothetical protein